MNEMQIMDNSIGGFKEIIDTYLSNHASYNNEKVPYECEYGELIFFKTRTNVITVFGIYIFPEYREKGLCRNILRYLIDVSRSQFKYLCVQSVLSNILYNYLSRFEYKNKSFSVKKRGFFYEL
jgi:hypothetical protein